MNREQARTEAINAASKSKQLARRVEDAAYSGDSVGEIPRFAQAATIWAEVAKAHAAIAAVLPATDEKTEA